MIVPGRAPVRPRVVSSLSGETLHLEEIIADLMQAQPRGTVQITGPAGSGKTTTLGHLAEVFAGANICFLDNPEKAQILAAGNYAWIIYAVPFPYKDFPATAAFTLAPWSMDEVLEYLLAVHRERCASVMSRLLSHPDDGLLEGNAALWRITLDTLAEQETILNVRDAFHSYLGGMIPSQESRLALGQLCVVQLLGGAFGPKDLKRIKEQNALEAMGLINRQRPLQLILAVSQIMADIAKDAACNSFSYRFPRDLFAEVVLAARNLPAVLDNLKTWFQSRPERHAMAASILSRCTAWMPEPGSKPNLTGAYLSGAVWPKIDLAGGQLGDVDLSDADLEQANFTEALAKKANFNSANLERAALKKITARQADLSHANLRGAKAPSGVFSEANLEYADCREADLEKANFIGANLAGANFTAANLREATIVEAQMKNADFSNTNLEGALLTRSILREAYFRGARFANAKLIGCDLEGMELPAADFRGANLHNALLTGSVMPEAIFDGACLQGAGLAEIDWERASLRDADLRGASFHLGSSRNGLVGSPIACEGSRTGFYTDDFNEQDFKAPEEIRKANLCHADLRGARIDDVDFYLVDLRHALLDPEQRIHLRRCGAILQDRR
jgi:uncharacterized protein YjbI with pentapeptide repeats